MTRPDPDPVAPDDDQVAVRVLTPADLDAVVAIDAASTGAPRQEFFRTRIADAMRDSTVHLSLAAELDGRLVGFLAAVVYYGEFGIPEPVAVLDTIGVHPDYRGRRVAWALIQQLETNLRGLRVERLRTEVDWDQFNLLGFFASSGFRPAPRLCLEKEIGG